MMGSERDLVEAREADERPVKKKKSSKDEATQWVRRVERAKWEARDRRYAHTIGVSKEARRAREEYESTLYSTDDEDEDENLGWEFCSRGSDWSDDSQDYFRITRNNMKD